MSTQVNESINNTISWKAPKNKNYAGTQSLLNRVMMAGATHLIGNEQYFIQLYNRLGIPMQNGTRHYLSQQAKALARRRAKQGQFETKKKRNVDKFEKLKLQLEKLMKDRAKNDYYGPGEGMTCTTNIIGSDKPARV